MKKFPDSSDKSKKDQKKLVMYPFITGPRRGNAERCKEAVDKLAQQLQEEMKEDIIKDPRTSQPQEDRTTDRFQINNNASSDTDSQKE